MFARRCGVSGIPHAVLVDANGKVVFSGHPGSLKDADVERAVQGALAIPLYELPAPFAKMRAAFSKGDLAGALREAKAASHESAPTVAEAIQGLVSGSLAGAKDLAAAGDYLGARAEYERLAKSLRGLPEANDVAKALAELQADPAAQKAIPLQKELEKILALPVKTKSNREERKGALEAFVKKCPDGFARERAKAELAKANTNKG